MAANENNEDVPKNSSERVEQPQPEKDPTNSSKSTKPVSRLDPTTGVKITVVESRPGQGGGMVLGLEHPVKPTEPKK